MLSYHPAHARGRGGASRHAWDQKDTGTKPFISRGPSYSKINMAYMMGMVPKVDTGTIVAGLSTPGGGGGRLQLQHTRMCVSKSEGHGSFFGLE